MTVNLARLQAGMDAAAWAEAALKAAEERAESLGTGWVKAFGTHVTVKGQRRTYYSWGESCSRDEVLALLTEAALADSGASGEPSNGGMKDA